MPAVGEELCGRHTGESSHRCSEKGPAQWADLGPAHREGAPRHQAGAPPSLCPLPSPTQPSTPRSLYQASEEPPVCLSLARGPAPLRPPHSPAHDPSVVLITPHPFVTERPPCARHCANSCDYTGRQDNKAYVLAKETTLALQS